ncbi:unnamed protein product, partial [Ixodes pacificus]
MLSRLVYREVYHPPDRRLSASGSDLSETSVTSLPTRGLESLEVLEVRDTPTLREFPSVYHFRFIRAAHLTYPYHCCAFQFPETHNPEEHSRCVLRFISAEHE